MMAVARGEYVGKLERRPEVDTWRRHPTAEWPTTLKITAAQVMIARFSGCVLLAAAYVAGRAAASSESRPGESSDTRHPVATDLPAWEIQAHRPWRPSRTNQPSRGRVQAPKPR
jgi:hypothetical protein